MLKKQMTGRNGHRKSFEQLSINSADRVITDIESLSPNRRASLIFMDQLPWKTTSNQVIKDLRLSVGQKHQPQHLTNLIAEKESRVAMTLSLQLIGYRIRSRKEIADKLEKRGISVEIIEKILNNLEQAGYLDEKTFVAMWIKDRAEIQGYGRQRIRNELLLKGIDIGLINSELARVYTEREEKDIAVKVAKKNLSKYKDLDLKVKRRRLTQALLRRGFSASIASRAIGLVIG